MTKRRPTLSHRPERINYGEFVLEREPGDHHWLMMRDCMLRTEQRFDRIDEQLKRIDERFDRVEDRFAKVDERFDRIDSRLDRMDERLDRMDERMGRMDQQIAAVTSAVKELTIVVASMDRRLCAVEAKVDDLVAWKHRAWGVVMTFSMLSGLVAFAASLLAKHVVG